MKKVTPTQLTLFVDPRDAILEELLRKNTDGDPWYDDPIHRYTGAKILAHWAYKAGYTDIDEAYYAQWAKIPRPGWNKYPFWLNCQKCHGQKEACQCCWRYYQEQPVQKREYEDNHKDHPETPCTPYYLRVPHPEN